MEEIGGSLDKSRYKRNPHLHSELHLLVDEVRNLFGEKAVKGKGSFAFYLGFFKRLGVGRVRRILGEVKESNADEPVKLFWYQVKEELKK